MLRSMKPPKTTLKNWWELFNMNDFKFSVSICVYGGDDSNWFEEAVESILNQTVKPTEIVLVVDGPVPESLDKVIYQYEQNDIFNVIRLPKNLGHGEARRVGLDNCKYDYVALMDADDISLPSRFEEQINILAKRPEIDIVGGDISEFIGETTNIVSYRTVPETDSEIKEYMKTRCPFNQMTVMFSKKAYHNAGGYIDWYCDEDYYLWIRMMLKGCKFANTGTTLVNVRVGEEMYQRRGGVRYFKSEAKLQKYMLDNKVIGISTYLINVLKRLIVQVLLPNKIRGFIFKKFAREKNNG